MSAVWSMGWGLAVMPGWEVRERVFGKCDPMTMRRPWGRGFQELRGTKATAEDRRVSLAPRTSVLKSSHK